MISPCRRTSATSPLSRNCCAFGGSFPISRSRETRPPSWSIVMIGSTSLRSRRSSIKFPQLRRALDIAAEQDESARLDPPKQDRPFRDRVRCREPR